MQLTNKLSKHNSAKKTKTQKNKPLKSHSKINGKLLSKKEGWIKIHIYGEPYERGFAHGVLLHQELKINANLLHFIVKTQIKTTIEKYMEVCILNIKPMIMNNYPEFYQELLGISEGAISKGINDITVDFLIAWNSILSLYSYFDQIDMYKCSAFIATGNHTEKGDIIMAHNTHCDFVTAQTSNIIIKVSPSTGGEFVMQTAAGYIASGTDWFICKNGIIGCETTISNMKYSPDFGDPYFCRSRKAMQYGNSLDDYVKIMLNNNAGDYACSWLLGDIKSNEIMLFELGYHSHVVQKTRDGVFYGMNSAINYKFRELETNDKDHYNITKSVGSRNFRFNYLLNEKYKGKINVDVAKEILSDHYDPFLDVIKMNSRNICKHYELDGENDKKKKYYPSGCVDGKVVNTRMAETLQFIGRFGSSCGRNFDVKLFLKKHPEYKSWKNYMVSFPTKKWILL